MCKTVKYILILFLLLYSSINAQERPKIGLVLSGGGAKGIAHVEVIKYLVDQGIPIDYISGTSMGSIVGGLFAVGYSPDDLEELVHNQNWEYLLTDHFNRQDYSPSMRDRKDRYFANLPFDKSGIYLPSGLKSGYHIVNMLTKYTLPVYQQTDFSKFDTPFLCVATNIENGEQIVLENGSLVDAMRASMAIPSYFTPVEIDGKLLVDGGLVNNYPVKELKDKGMDIIIGVDVQSQLYKKDELNSLVKITYQAIFLNSEKKYQENLKLTDVYIQPDISGFGMFSFSPENADTLLNRGFVAAKLKQFALDSLIPENYRIDYSKKNWINKDQRNDTLKVCGIEVDGLKNIKTESFKKYFWKPKKYPISLSVSDIENKINDALLSDLFQTISYQPKLTDTGVVLRLKVVEKSPGNLKLGVHYDTELSASILAGLSYRNLFFQGSNINMDLRIGENPHLSAEYFIKSRVAPYFALKADYNQFDKGYYETNSYRNPLAEVRNKTLLVSSILGAYAGKSLFIGGGLEYESTNQRSLSLNELDTNYQTFNYFGNIELDTRDSKYFSTKGIYLKANLKFIDNIEMRESSLYKPGISSNNTFQYTIPFLKKKLAFKQVINAAFTGENPPTNYQVEFGGGNNINYNNYIEFLGMRRGTLVADYGVKTRLILQYSPFKNNYVTIKSDLGSISNDLINTLTFDDLIYGWGVFYGINSPIGPIEISVQESNKVQQTFFFINIGFWF